MLRSYINRIKRVGKPKEILSAVHDDDLVKFLQSLGVLQDVEAGKIKCKFCGDQIDMDRFQALLPDSGSLSFVCNKPVCIRLFINYMEEKNG